MNIRTVCLKMLGQVFLGVFLISSQVSAGHIQLNADFIFDYVSGTVAADVPDTLYPGLNDWGSVTVNSDTDWDVFNNGGFGDSAYYINSPAVDSTISYPNVDVGPFQSGIGWNGVVNTNDYQEVESIDWSIEVWLHTPLYGDYPDDFGLLVYILDFEMSGFTPGIVFDENNSDMTDILISNHSTTSSLGVYSEWYDERDGGYYWAEGFTDDFSVVVANVPEPGSLFLLLVGFASIFLSRKSLRK